MHFTAILFSLINKSIIQYLSTVNTDVFICPFVVACRRNDGI